jgi:hypothetical protein
MTGHFFSISSYGCPSEHLEELQAVGESCKVVSYGYSICFIQWLQMGSRILWCIDKFSLNSRHVLKDDWNAAQLGINM